MCEEVLEQTWFLMEAEDDARYCDSFYPVKGHKEKWERGTYFPNIRGVLHDTRVLCRILDVNIKYFEQFRQACIETGICKAPKKEGATLEQD